MKVAVVGASGSIGSRFFEHLLRREDVSSVIAITRKPLSSTPDKAQNVIIPDFGTLDLVPNATWSSIRDADALIWAIGTYDLNENVNLTYPLEFQRHLALHQRSSHTRENNNTKFRFILLGGAFTETDQSRWLYFLPNQRRMKGLLQTKTLEFAEAHDWAAHVIRPGGILMGESTMVHQVAEATFRSSLVIRGEELGAFVAELAVHGSERNVIENLEMVETGRRLTAEGVYKT